MPNLETAMTPPDIPCIFVTWSRTPSGQATWQFNRAFKIGRVPECDVYIPDEHVSRTHAEVSYSNGGWWIRDLQSSNGIYVDGQPRESSAIGKNLSVRLGIEGPELVFVVETPLPNLPPPVYAPPAIPVASPPAAPSQAAAALSAERYFGKATAGEPYGEKTMFIRKAFADVQKKQKHKYGGAIAVLAVCILAVGAYAFYLQQQRSKQKQLAENLFYSMKSLDLDIANVEKLVMDAHSQQGVAEIRKFQSRRAEAEKNYDQFLTTLHTYDRKLTEQQRLILRVARIFGECELDIPPGFEEEIGNYIKKWQSSGRLARAVERARANGYTEGIAKEMLAQDLPPQFFYLALQESDFDPYISGPMTYMGIAKGMWQFIPQTGVKYGLKMGPLVDFARPDTSDDRHHWNVETKAAAAYLKDLYSSDAQASGLLVMACYNWGEKSVLPLVRSLPANPRERNFWRLLSGYREKIPQQTYDYVFYITSAAVIGENPRLFGFNFDNPLAQLEHN